jgi:hypothetical protein
MEGYQLQHCTWCAKNLGQINHHREREKIIVPGLFYVNLCLSGSVDTDFHPNGSKNMPALSDRAVHTFPKKSPARRKRRATNTLFGFSALVRGYPDDGGS